MVVTVDKNIEEPIYRQIRSQVIAGIASGELAVGQALPSVRRLASDLGINFHTVNKAYAVLRDEGYLVLRGRSGAFVAKPAPADGSAAQEQLKDDLAALALAFRAKGGTAEQFRACAEGQACEAFGVTPAGLSADSPLLGKESAKAAEGAKGKGGAKAANARKSQKAVKRPKAAAPAEATPVPPKRSRKKAKAPAKQVEFVQLSLLGD